MRRLMVGIVGSLFGLLVLVQGQAFAQDARQNAPGKFDFYLLALSWSPSFCEQAGDRKNAQQQCGERPFSFVVHGLWPQYEKGFPEFCQNPPPMVDARLINSMLDLMPARGLIIHEWRKHGVCVGQAPGAYFEMIRRARAAVKIPPQYLEPQTALDVTPGEVEEAFVAANPGMSRAGVAVSCGGTRLSGVRICMTRDLQFRDCPEVDRRACTRDKLTMPPVRGGSARSSRAGTAG
jgi:ribonuclease T2